MSLFFSFASLYIPLSSHLSQDKVDDFIRSDIPYIPSWPHFNLDFAVRYFSCWYHLHIFVLSVICLLCQLTIKGLPHSFCFVVMYYKSQNTSRTTEYKHVLSKEMRGIDISQQDTCWSKIHYNRYDQFDLIKRHK